MVSTFASDYPLSFFGDFDLSPGASNPPTRDGSDIQCDSVLAASPWRGQTGAATLMDQDLACSSGLASYPPDCNPASLGLRTPLEQIKEDSGAFSFSSPFYFDSLLRANIESLRSMPVPSQSSQAFSSSIHEGSLGSSWGTNHTTSMVLDSDPRTRPATASLIPETYQGIFTHLFTGLESNPNSLKSLTTRTPNFEDPAWRPETGVPIAPESFEDGRGRLARPLTAHPTSKLDSSTGSLLESALQLSQIAPRCLQSNPDHNFSGPPPDKSTVTFPPTGNGTILTSSECRDINSLPNWLDQAMMMVEPESKCQDHDHRAENTWQARVASGEDADPVSQMRRRRNAMVQLPPLVSCGMLSALVANSDGSSSSDDESSCDSADSPGAWPISPKSRGPRSSSAAPPSSSQPSSGGGRSTEIFKMLSHWDFSCRRRSRHRNSAASRAEKEASVKMAAKKCSKTKRTFSITSRIVLRPRAGSDDEEVAYPTIPENPQEAFMNDGPHGAPSEGFEEEVDESESLFASDLYAPRLTRRGPPGREGWCSLCPQGGWYSMKRSQYLYHMQYDHGISSLTRKVFEPPSMLRIWNDEVETTDGLCEHCSEWIPICFGPVRKRDFKAWFKHAHKCHRDKMERSH